MDSFMKLFSFYALNEPLINVNLSSIIKALSKNEKLTATDKKRLYERDSKMNEIKNKEIPKKRKQVIRMMTYNVHMWMDSFNKDNTKGVMEIIEEMDADVLVLQECHPDYSISKENKTIREELMRLGYNFHFRDCIGFNVGELLFGNLIACKNDLSCEFSSETYIKNYGGEDRNFVKAIVKKKSGSEQKITVYGTHLDVFDNSGETRRSQINQLLEDFEKEKQKLTNGEISAVITGDFNSVRKKDYLYPVNNQLAWNLISNDFRKVFGCNLSETDLHSVEEKGFVDSFSKSGSPFPPYTVWSGIVCDFFFLSPSFRPLVVGSYVYYSPVSDHLPIVVDISF